MLLGPAPESPEPDASGAPASPSRDARAAADAAPGVAEAGSTAAQTGSAIEDSSDEHELDATEPLAVSPAPEPVAAAAAPLEPAPSLDVARIEADGSALFAGRASPGERIEVRVGGVVVATAEAGPDGGFVAYGAVPGGGAQRVELRVSEQTVAADPIIMATPESDGPNAPPTVVLQARPDGVALMQAPPRPSQALVTLDVLSYAEGGAVEVSGRGEALRRLRVWADDTMIAETTIGEDGRWAARSAVTLAPGTYVLRVDALAPDGAVAFSVSSPFRREAPEQLAVAKGDIVIQPGDSLWRIAENRYGQGVRYTLIFEANADRIRDPDLIYPGQVFKLPQPAAD
jgi:nucleoid-associated protein YgaU